MIFYCKMRLFVTAQLNREKKSEKIKSDFKKNG